MSTSGQMLVVNFATDEKFALSKSWITLWICIDGKKSLNDLTRATKIPKGILREALTELVSCGLVKEK